METIFDKSDKGRSSFYLGEDMGQKKEDIPQNLCRQDALILPDCSELDVVRHYVNLSKRNTGIDTHFTPLGSCTMKYNPKIADRIASWPQFTEVHPLSSPKYSQGMLAIFYRLGHILSQITGMESFSFQSAAGAQGELIGLKMIHAYHQDRGDKERSIILVPDTAHGTNPASAKLANMTVKTIPTDQDGNLSLDDLEKHLKRYSANIAGLMLTNPSTLGLFDRHILEISQKVHDVGGLLYYDGANLNAIIGKCRIFDMGFDVIHLNLHKTFATPHGGGGPGSGPVGANAKLAPYLPSPLITYHQDNDIYAFHEPHRTIGKTLAFHGQFVIVLRAYVYILSIGKENLKKISENAVLLANYIKESLKPYYDIPYDRTCK